MSASVRVIQVGLGPIGCGIASRVHQSQGMELVGGVDLDPKLSGKPLCELPGLEGGPTLAVSAELDQVVEAQRPDVAVLSTVSDLDRLAPTAVKLLEAGVAVVSTCEEMVFPRWTRPAETAALDAAAKKGETLCLGVGINPGFVLDLLPAMLSAPLGRISAIRGSRVVDAGQRRGPLQRKVGGGLSVAEFEAKVAAGGFGHRGMMESLHLLCDAVGVSVEGASQFIEPVIADEDVETPFVSLKAGQVAGIHQGAKDAQGIVTLDIKMYVGAKKPGDRVEIDGEPRVRVQVEGGYQGDQATCWIAANACRLVARGGVNPGFRTLLEIPPILGRFE